MNFAKADKRSGVALPELAGETSPLSRRRTASTSSLPDVDLAPPVVAPPPRRGLSRLRHVVVKYAKFLGPGMMVSVLFIDPGNYSALVAGGSVLQYKLLFIIAVANVLAAFLQVLCTKLGCVTGLNLAQNCRKHLPPRLNLAVYVMAELAIIATDLAEVVGTAIALNILFGIPLSAGVIVTILDVMLVLYFYKPKGPLFVVRLFEGGVAILVVATVVCFAIELAKASDLINAKEVALGFLPHHQVFRDDGLYLLLAVLGATVMPHSLYLGSGVVQPRLKEYDIKHGNYAQEPDADEEVDDDGYRPSLAAVQHTMNYAVAELMVSLFTVALFVNAAILILAGALLYSPSSAPPDAHQLADLFSIYELLRDHLSPSAGKVFALALLFSGQLAGIVVTLSGQMISEGFLSWSILPVVRRLVTRLLAVLPCLLLTSLAGRRGLANVLNVLQVALSLLLPFVSAPLVWFVCRRDIMHVSVSGSSNGSSSYASPGDDSEIELPLWNSEGLPGQTTHDMTSSLFVRVTAVAIWLVITFLNIYLIFDMIW